MTAATYTPLSPPSTSISPSSALITGQQFVQTLPWFALSVLAPAVVLLSVFKLFYARRRRRQQSPEQPSVATLFLQNDANASKNVLKKPQLCDVSLDCPMLAEAWKNLLPLSARLADRSPVDLDCLANHQLQSSSYQRSGHPVLQPKSPTEIPQTPVSGSLDAHGQRYQDFHEPDIIHVAVVIVLPSHGSRETSEVAIGSSVVHIVDEKVCDTL